MRAEMPPELSGAERKEEAGRVCEASVREPNIKAKALNLPGLGFWVAVKELKLSYHNGYI